MKWIYAIVTTLLASVLVFETNAREMIGVPEKQLTTEQQQKLASGCAAASASRELNINNVRARIMNGGDMWWDLVSSARYEVPKVTGEGTRRHSMFAGSLWIGGFDPGGNLRLAAMTYRQSGEDFWPGPLDTATASTTADRCDDWDDMWRITREEINEFREADDYEAAMTDVIRDWPAHGDPARGESFYLAPFVDVNGSGVYEPEHGDYPDITGDQSIWYVYNDAGNVHTESNAAAIGLEVHTEAFAFQTNDELNNATFYDHIVYNRSRDRLDSTFFGKWADPDVGYAFNDYVGSDPDRNLGYAYVGEEYDPGATGYGFNPPAIGTIFFSGPEGDDGEEIGMENFIYYNNTFALNGNPQRAIHYYNYLNAHWKDGRAMCWGGDAFRNCWDASREPSFMYPDDPRDDDGWSEVTAGNPVGDRRHLQSAGPFTLEPGAVNDVTVGIVWARTGTGGNLGSLDLLFHSTDRAQELYDNNFELLDGPDAPDIEITELDRKLILNLVNTRETENYIDTFPAATGEDIIYRFQGYKVYQLRNQNVSVTDLDDEDEARRVAQFDLRDDIERVTNRVLDPETNEFIPRLMVEGSGTGIDHTIEITTDRFADEDDRLANYSPYHFMIVAYAVADDPDVNRRYLQGRLNVRSHTGIPHNPKHRFGGANVRSDYGDRPNVTRIEGIGNNAFALDLTEESRDRILSDGKAEHITYTRDNAPFDIKVVNPLNLTGDRFRMELVDTVQNDETLIDSTARWQITNLESGEVYHSDTTLAGDDEKLLKDHGFSVRINQIPSPGIGDPTELGFIEASMRFDEVGEEWLTGVQNFEVLGHPFNWIRTGTNDEDALPQGLEVSVFGSARHNQAFLDPNGVYDGLLNGTIAPFALVSGGYQEGQGETVQRLTHGARPHRISTPDHFNTRRNTSTPMQLLSSVDLVFTPNKDKWSRSPVVETGEDPVLNQGRQEKFLLRDHPKGSLGKHGDWDENTQGMSYFPGYAINIETGERLNVMFGEASNYVSHNGADMKWNPTSRLTSPGKDARDPDYFIAGGKHYTYIMGAWEREEFTIGNPLDPDASHDVNPVATHYDEGEAIHAELSDESKAPNNRIANVYSSAMWVMKPMLASGFELESYEDGLIPNEAKIRLRVNRPFERFAFSEDTEYDGVPTYEFSFEEISTQKEQKSIAEDALDDVGMVPNPYYASSPYEATQLDNRVRIINVPRSAKISIYSKDGTMIRQFDRLDRTDDEHSTYIDWNLRNRDGVPISGGLYIVHVDAPGVGQTSFKWFAVTRPLDLDTF